MLAIPFGNPAILLSKTGGFASPPLGGFALIAVEHDARTAIAFQRSGVNKNTQRQTIDVLRTSDVCDRSVHCKV
jgi:hypothetical protein